MAGGQPLDVRDDVFVGMLRELAREAALSTDDREVAAFIIRDGDGALTCHMWPQSAGFRSHHFDGAIPPGTVAIAHSHPFQMPAPSNADALQAMRIGLPIYAVSRWELHVATPSGERLMLLTGRSWTGRAERRECTKQVTSRRTD